MINTFVIGIEKPPFFYLRYIEINSICKKGNATGVPIFLLVSIARKKRDSGPPVSPDIRLGIKKGG
jgi:hypothetical protein